MDFGHVSNQIWDFTMQEYGFYTLNSYSMGFHNSTSRNGLDLIGTLMEPSNLMGRAIAPVDDTLNHCKGTYDANLRE